MVVKGVSFIASILIAKMLGSFDFGELSILKTTLSVFSLFATFGLGITVTKIVADASEKTPNDVRNIVHAAKAITFVLGAVLGTTLIGFAPFISKQILHSDTLVVPLRISGMYLFFNALNVYQLGVIAGLRAFKDLARINIIIAIITLPVLISFTYFFGLNGTLMGLTVNLIINWYLNQLLISRITRKMGLLGDRGIVLMRIRSLLKFSYPLALKEIIYSVSNWALFYLLLIQTSYAEIGIFNSANQLCQLILFLPGSILNVFLSLLSHQIANQNASQLLVRKNILFTTVITTGIGSVVILLSPLIYRFYGHSFAGGENVLLVLTIATAPMALANVLEQIWISHGKPLVVATFQVMIQALMLTSGVLLLQIEPSALSISFAFLISYALSVTVMMFYMRRNRML